MKSKLLALALAGAALLALAAACGDDEGDDTDATPEDGASVCDQADAVQQAVGDLVGIEVLAEGTDALNASVADVRTELDDLKGAVSADVEDEVQGLDDAVAEAEEVLSGVADDDTLNEKIDDVQTALTGVATAAAALGDALSAECG